jgi:L-fuculose-phosphate aldolase
LGLKQELIYYSKQCSSSGFVKATDGNLSVRTKKNFILSTATQTRKSRIRLTDIVKTDLKGRKHGGKRQSSTELKMHLYIYSKRKDINAVIHTHPVYASAFAVAGKAMNRNILPEIYLQIGKIPLAKFAVPSTEEVPGSLETYIGEHNVILLQNHGLVAFGRDLEEAFMLTEKAEQYAKILVLAKILGGAKELTPAQLKKLDMLKPSPGKN